MIDRHDLHRLPARPAVSVIVTVYRHGAFLRQCLDSILAQRTRWPFEIIVAEDCSDDDSLALALAVQAERPDRVRVLSGPVNRGMNRNFRHAMAHARAPIIAICEGDDYWIDPNRLQRGFDLMALYPHADLLFARAIQSFPDGHQRVGWDFGPVPRIVTAQALFAGHGWITATATMMWRRTATQDWPDWLDEAPFGDAAIVAAGTARGGAIYDPVPSAVYRIAQPSSFGAAYLASSPAQQLDYARQAEATLRAVQRHWHIPNAVIGHRIDDQRWRAVGRLWAMRRWAQAALTAASIRPSFWIRALVHKLGRSISRS